MARPRKTGLDYFPHDIDVTTDPKIEPAILRYGAAAYAFYFVHLEYCYRSADLSVDVSATETGEEMREVIQRKLHISAEEYDGILKSFLRHGAFDETYYLETGRLTSNGIKKRAQKVFGKRERESDRYNNNVSSSISVAETTAETGEIKEKKTKEKDKTPLSPKGGTQPQKPDIQLERFDAFWAAYPKKVGKGAARKSWARINPTRELHAKILAAVADAKRSEQWRREGGRFIPNPATWLNQERWEDSVSVEEDRLTDLDGLF